MIVRLSVLEILQKLLDADHPVSTYGGGFRPCWTIRLASHLKHSEATGDPSAGAGRSCWRKVQILFLSKIAMLMLILARYYV